MSRCSNAIGIALALGAFACQSPKTTDGGNPPNVVLIVCDDAGYVDFGCTGSTELETPHIDSIAAGGVRFTQGYAVASVCSPSRAGLLTGRYPQRFGHEMNIPRRAPDPELGLPRSETTLADALRERGYRTAAIGKWHLGAHERFHPLERGFDEFYGYLGGSRSYFPDTTGTDAHTTTLRGLDPLPEREGTYVTDLLSDEAVAFIERQGAEPFFLYLSYTAVHGPMHAKPGDLDAYARITPLKRRKLAAMTKALDDGVGRVLAALRAGGREDDTIVFFINDNGGATNNASDNGPWRGMKGSKFEGGIRVPFLVRWPARLAGGRDYTRPVSALDVYATCVTAVGGRPERDGVDLAPYLDGVRRDDPHAALYWRRGAAAAVRSGRWKLIRVETNPLLLFDLEHDPGEQANVAPDHPQQCQRLISMLESWELELIDPRWTTAEVWRRNQIEKHRMHIVGRQSERELP